MSADDIKTVPWAQVVPHLGACEGCGAVAGQDCLVENCPQRKEWNATQLQEDFSVIGFSAPFVVVVRKADGVKGSLEFAHHPRAYFGFKADA